MLELFGSLRFLVGAACSFLSLGGVVVCYLGMLGGLFVVTFFMRLGSLVVRLGCVFVVRSGFVVIVFWHIRS